MTLATTSGVRGIWLQSTVRELQVLIGHLSCVPRARRFQLIERFASRLIAPESPAERLLLRGLIVETGLRLLIAGSCDAPPEVVAVMALASALDDGSVADASRDRRTVVSVADMSQRRQAGIRIQHYIEANLSHHVTLKQVARGTGVSIRQVNPCLKAAVGLSVRQFLLRRRLGKIVEALTTSDVKIEAIALDVGYRSKKDLYRLLRQFTGFTPSRLRALAHGRSRSESDR
jgi:AraC-like DNA-binding protein